MHLYTKRSFEITSIDLCKPEIKQIWRGLKYEFEKILIGYVYIAPNFENNTDLNRSISCKTYL